jgi:biopolymer transport protein ExbD
MDRAFGAPRKTRRPIINITSLIDVMFLLLIFFMISSTFREHFGIDVSLPSADTAVSQEQNTHDITVSAQGGVFFGGDVVSVVELRAALADLLEKEPEASIVLRADEKAAFQDVIKVIDTARKVGGTQLVIPTEPSGAKDILHPLQ